VSQFIPTSRSISGDDQPDLLASAVLNSLTRPLYHGLSWGPLRTCVVAWLTVGVLPMFLLLRWLKDFIATQQQQLWHLAEWMRVQGGDHDATELQKASHRVRFNMPLAILSGALVLVAIGAVVAYFSHHTFSYRALLRFAFHAPVTPPQLVFTFALSAAAVCHWAHVVWHQQNVEHYLRWFNQLMTRQAQDEVRLPRLELGLDGTWIVAGVVLAVAGGLWGVPVLLAAGAHRRYIIEGSVRMRSTLAERLRAMLLERRPRMRIPSPIQIVRSCVRPNCRAPLPSAASWCPRCGTKAIRRMDVVA
jgi:hypothetical protein